MVKVFAQRDPAPFWRYCPLLEFTPHFGDLQSAATRYNCKVQWSKVQRQRPGDWNLQDRRGRVCAEVDWKKKMRMRLNLPVCQWEEATPYFGAPTPFWSSRHIWRSPDCSYTLLVCSYTYLGFPGLRAQQVGGQYANASCWCQHETIQSPLFLLRDNNFIHSALSDLKFCRMFSFTLCCVTHCMTGHFQKSIIGAL